MPTLTESLAQVANAAALLPMDSAALAGLAEDELLVRTPEKFVQHLTGSTGEEAAKLVRTGVMIHEAEVLATSERTGEVPPELTCPWLAPVGRAVAAGTLSIEASESIRRGLGVPSDDISAEMLAEAAAHLVEAASCLDSNPLNADDLLVRARMVRDELDESGIADREKALRNARSLRRYRRPDGMTSYSLLADPENAAYLDGIYDCLTSPRRGGPRMVDLSDTTRAEAIETDPRSTEQLCFDEFLAIVRIGVSTDEKTAARSVLGSRRPAVRVLVTQKSLETDTASTRTSRPGYGRIEGHEAPVSMETVERTICTNGIVPLVFDTDGQCIDVGREQRLYTARQRIGLAARDGGCRWPGCDRPVSWTEAHQINHWARDNGRTDIADGMLLCRYHHLLLHDNHWEITRDGAQYWLVPPASEDLARTPRLMPSKSAALTDLQREQSGRMAQRTG